MGNILRGARLLESEWALTRTLAVRAATAQTRQRAQMQHQVLIGVSSSKRARQTRVLLWSCLFLLAGCSETAPASDAPLNPPQTELAQMNSSMEGPDNAHFVTKQQ